METNLILWNLSTAFGFYFMKQLRGLFATFMESPIDITPSRHFTLANFSPALISYLLAKKWWLKSLGIDGMSVMPRVCW